MSRYLQVYLSISYGTLKVVNRNTQVGTPFAFGGVL